MKKTITLEIPPQLEMLCNLLETTPQWVIQGFINDVSLSLSSNGSDERMMATDYFMRCGYGMPRFEYGQVEQMLEELKAWHTRWKKVKEQHTAKGEGQ